MPHFIAIGAVDQNFDVIGYMHNDRHEIATFCQNESPKVITNLDDRMAIGSILQMDGCLVSKQWLASDLI